MQTPFWTQTIRATGFPTPTRQCQYAPIKMPTPMSPSPSQFPMELDLESWLIPTVAPWCSSTMGPSSASWRSRPSFWDMGGTVTLKSFIFSSKRVWFWSHTCKVPTTAASRGCACCLPCQSALTQSWRSRQVCFRPSDGFERNLKLRSWYPQKKGRNSWAEVTSDKSSRFLRLLFCPMWLSSICVAAIQFVVQTFLNRLNSLCHKR